MTHDSVANFPRMFKGNLIFECLDELSHFMDFLLGDGETKSTFEFGECDPEVMPRAEFTIV
jgi:hypothetical protein